MNTTTSGAIEQSEASVVTNAPSSEKPVTDHIVDRLKSVKETIAGVSSAFRKSPKNREDREEMRKYGE